MELKDVKIGMKVKIARKLPQSEDPGWMPEMDRLIGRIATVADTFGNRVRAGVDGDYWYYEPESLEPIGVSAIHGQAKILYQEATIKGVPCVKIVEFEGIKRKDELPRSYVKNLPVFWSCEARFFSRTFDGASMKRNDDWEERSCLSFDIPYGGIPEIDMLGCSTVLRTGDIWPRTTFDAILIWLKRAGARLAKINREPRWSKTKEAVI